MHWEINKLCRSWFTAVFALSSWSGVELGISLKVTCTLLLCCFVSALVIKSSLRLAAVSLCQGPIALFFDHLLTFWHSDSARKYLKYPKLALYFLCPCPKISCFPKVPWLLLLDDVRTQCLAAGVHTATGCHCLQAPSVNRAVKQSHVKRPMHIHISIILPTHLYLQ